MAPRRCSHLAGQCIHTGDHWDHLSKAYAVPSPRATGPKTLIEVRMEEWAEAVPAVALYAEGDTADLTAREAATAAVGLLGAAWQLLRCSILLAVAQRVEASRGADAERCQPWPPNSGA